VELPLSDVDRSAAIRHVQQVHGPVLLRYLTRMTRGDVHRAEDILQETLMRAWRSPEAQTHDGHWSRAWLFTVARRVAIDSMRSALARPAEFPDERIDTHAAATDDFQRAVDAHEVRAALAELPERWRVTLLEIFVRERSVAETAELLQVPPGTVKSRTFYGLRALREALIGRGFIVGDSGLGGVSTAAVTPGR
jgi:RNA polymerase sigma-70 factor, ECF subfamily